MNLQKYIYIILSVICITACVKDVVVEIPVVKEPETVNVTLGVNTTRYTTKAFQDHGSTEPTLEEKRIFNYSILIFNAAQQLEAALTASPYDPADPNSKGVEYTGPLRFLDEDGNDIVVELTSGVKKIFALVNASQSLLEERDELIARENVTLQDFSLWILNVGARGGLGLITGKTAVPVGEERGFLMTCEDGMQSLTIHPPGEEGEVQNIVLSVGRAMAKVSVASDLSREQQPNGELSDITYKIVNNPFEMYIVPSFLDNLLITPHTGGNQRSEEFYFESPGELSENYTPISKQGSLSQVYCMEHAVTDLEEELGTAVILKGIYTPYTLYQANGVDLYAGYKKADPFWRIANMQDGKRISYENKYYGEDPTDYLAEGQEAIKYPEGVTYYSFYLRNDNSLSPYTVKRNSYYNIDITKVNDAGEEGEEDVDPINPPPPPPPPPPVTPPPGPNPNPDPGPQIEVNIQITDWQGIDQGAGL